MKPSEIIYEKYKRICKEHKCSPDSEMSMDYGYLQYAIMEYLDELVELNNLINK